MMIPLRYFFLLVCSLGLLFSCENDSIGNSTVHEGSRQFLDPIYFDSDFEKEVNFSLLFQDSLIESQQIQYIDRFFIQSEMIDEDIQTDTVKHIRYSFDRTGKLIEQDHQVWADHRLIEHRRFTLRPDKQFDFFHHVQVRNFLEQGDDEFETHLEHEETPFYPLYQPPVKHKKFTRLLDLEEDYSLYLVPSWKYWGSLSIDSILHPKEEDWIVQGNLEKPFKRYRVKNVVEETDVYQFEYWRSGSLKIRMKTGPHFREKRSFIYDSKTDFWTSYTDSIFSENKFIYRQLHQISYDSLGRPTEVKHLNRKTDQFSRSERFIYTKQK
ncbi:MAG: hypothetical protein EP338_10125 [Bacteroidetes bacterium]|nr:MAG: hypothetical protein EP338_10125 [Bacteroidota bacterium]